MTLVPSVENELENIRRFASLVKDDATYGPPEKDSGIQALLKSLSTANRETRSALDETNKLQGQTYLDGCHAELAWAWAAVKNAARRTHPPVPTDKITEPLITVAPTGSFNAVSLKEPSGRTAIVFDASLIGALYTIALHCGWIFHDWIEDYGSGDMEKFATRLPDVTSISLLKEALSDLVAHGVVTPASILKIIDHIPSASYELGLLIYFRLMQFLMGHEFSHFVYDHHLVDSDKAKLSDSPLFDLLQESLERRAAHFPELVEPNDEQNRRFLFQQFHEYQADEQSLTFLAVSGAYQNRDPAKRRLFVVDLAAITIFFMASLAIERMVFIRIRGRDPAASDLYSNEFGVQNLCLRTSHPSPMSRLAWMKGQVEVRMLGGDDADAFFDPVSRYFDWAVGIDRGARKYMRVEPQAVAKKWASRYSNVALLAALWPGKEVPNLMEWLAQLQG